MMLAAITAALFWAQMNATPAHAEAGLEGVTGLLNVPTAEVLKDGEVELGYGRNNNNVRFPGKRQRNYFAGIGFLPGLELTARYIDFPEIPETGIPGFGTRKDRSVNAKFQLLSEERHPLALAVGIYDVGGQAVQERGAYGAVTKTFGAVQFTAGYGDKHQDGFFGGVSVKPAKGIDLIYEYDSFDHNYGVRLSPHPDWHFTLGSVAGDFAFGLSYNKTLTSGRNPKPSCEGLHLSRLPAEGNDPASDLALELARQGMVDVRIGWSDDVLDVEYGNRRFRTEEEAWAFACDWAASRAPASTKLVRVHSLRAQSPVLITSFSPDDLISFVNGQATAEDFSDKLEIHDNCLSDTTSWSRAYSSSNGATDIFLMPACTLDLGRAYEPVRHRSGIAVEQATSLGGGFALASRSEFPLVNNLDNRDSPFFTRGLITQMQPWGGGWYTAAEAGYFGDRRWGGQLELRKFWRDSRFDLGVIGGVVRNKFSDTTDEQFLGSGSIRIPSLDLTLTGTTGRFIWGDEGFRIQAGRRFGTYSVEFFYYNSTYTENEAGVRVNIPLLGYSGRSSRFRLDLAPVFPYEYRTSPAHMAETLHYAGSVYEFRSWLYPWHMRENLYLLKGAPGVEFAPRS